MKKLLAILLALTLCGLLPAALAEGVTLKTVSTFAGTDAAAGAYVELLEAWGKETGNKVEDASATSDEAWKTGVLNDFAAGNEADVLFYFAKTADSAPILNKVVPISEINAAYPDLDLMENAAIAEADGTIYAIPVRAFWEGLFVNTDLFEKYGLELPTDWAKLEAAIAKFNEEGIVPIAVSFADVPHYIVEFAIIASGTPEEHKARPAAIDEVPDSWKEGMALLNKLQVHPGRLRQGCQRHHRSRHLPNVPGQEGCHAAGRLLVRQRYRRSQLGNHHGYALPHLCRGCRTHRFHRRRFHGLLPQPQGVG